MLFKYVCTLSILISFFVFGYTSFSVNQHEKNQEEFENAIQREREYTNLIYSIYEKKIPNISEYVDTCRNKQLNKMVETLDEIALGSRNNNNTITYIIAITLICMAMISHDNFYYTGNKCLRIVSEGRENAPYGFLF